VPPVAPIDPPALPELGVTLPEPWITPPEVSGASPLDVSPLDSSAPDPGGNPEEEPEPEPALWPEVAETVEDDPCPPHPIAQTRPRVMASGSLDR
jgi:hypothetical protein